MENRKSYNQILKQIVYQCREENHPVSEALVSYILNILYDENSEDFYFSKHSNSLNENMAKEIMNKTMKLLNLHKDGELETLKLQVAYELAHVQEEEKIENIKSYFDAEISNLLKEITYFQSSTRRDYDSIQVHKKIFSFLLVKTRQNSLESLDEFDSENSSELGISSEREIYAVLDGVLPKSGLPPFVSLSSQDKIAQLSNLSDIVMGIRLMNKEIEKGGIGLMSLKDLKKKFEVSLLDEVESYYRKIADTSERYTAVYENVDFDLVSMNEKTVLEKIRKIVIYFKQVLTYLSIVVDDLTNCFATVDELSKNYEKEINYLVDIVEKKSPISKEQAYPHFSRLAKLYSNFQDQSFITDIRENVFYKIQEFVTANEISEFFSEDEFEGKFQEHIDKVDIYINKEAPIFYFESGMYQNGVSVLLPHATADYPDIKLEYRGFCISTLLNKHGLLVEGRPDVVTKFKERYMVFANQSCVYNFIDNPSIILEELSQYVKKNPYMINLLNLTEDFPNANLSSIFRDKENPNNVYKSSSVMVDKTVQTVTHIYEEGYIDPNYVWNEWELKKKAIQLADIMRKKTVSCQTNLSHNRRENETQVYPKKETAVNTTVSKGTNLSIPKQYVSDVRYYDKNY